MEQCHSGGAMGMREQMRVGGSPITKISTVYENCVTSVEKRRLLAFLFVALLIAVIKQMRTG